VVEAVREDGTRHARAWRHEGTLDASMLVTRVRWQLEAWLTGAGLPDDDEDPVTAGGLVDLRLVPDEVVPVTGRQLGMWGPDGAAAARAGRALVRVQGLVGVEKVVTAVTVGGRSAAERIRWVPWGEPRSGTPGSAPWPGRVPGPAPGRVFEPPLPAELTDEAGRPVTVDGRGEASASPAALQCAGLPGGGGPVLAWAGPWPYDLRWWARRRRSRGALWQLVIGHLADADAPDHHLACLVRTERGRAGVGAVYD
jgi:protein ImuB